MTEINSIEVISFIKWAGGKNQLIDQLSSYLPKKIENYFEPFVGSGAFRKTSASGTLSFRHKKRPAKACSLVVVMFIYPIR
jgi:hypothetical protein